MTPTQTIAYLFTKIAPVIIVYGAMVFGFIYFVVTIIRIIQNPEPSNFRMYYIGDGADGGEPLGDGSGDSGFCDLVGFDCGGFDGGGCDGGDG
jgi:hypothetical protein